MHRIHFYKHNLIYVCLAHLYFVFLMLLTFRSPNYTYISPVFYVKVIWEKDRVIWCLQHKPRDQRQSSKEKSRGTKKTGEMCTSDREFKLGSKDQGWKKKVDKGHLLKGLRPTADYVMKRWCWSLQCNSQWQWPSPKSYTLALHWWSSACSACFSLILLHHTGTQALPTGFLRGGYRQEFYSLSCRKDSSLQETPLQHDCKELQCLLKS